MNRRSLMVAAAALLAPLQRSMREATAAEMQSPAPHSVHWQTFAEG
jgi:hypothetical protein